MNSGFHTSLHTINVNLATRLEAPKKINRTNYTTKTRDVKEDKPYQLYHKPNETMTTISTRGVHGVVWFGFEHKSYPNCEIKKHVVWFGSVDF